MIFLTNFFKGTGLATLSFNWYSMAQRLLGRSCFKYLNIMKKLPHPLPPPLNSMFQGQQKSYWSKKCAQN